MALPPLAPRSLPEPPNLSFRQRGSVKLVLALLLIATVAGGAGGLIHVAMGGTPEDTLAVVPPGQLPQRMLMLALAGLVNAGSAVATWSFRRWGVYGVVCTSLVAFVINWKIGGVPVAVPGLVAVAGVAVFSMVAWVEFD